MNKGKKTIYNNGSVKVQVTPNVKIVNQSTLWGDKKKDYVFVPATQRGFVFIINPEASSLLDLVQGYTLYRPCALSLSFSIDYNVIFETIPMEVAHERRNNTHSASWSIVGMVSDSCDDIPF